MSKNTWQYLCIESEMCGLPVPVLTIIGREHMARFKIDLGAGTLVDKDVHQCIDRARLYLLGYQNGKNHHYHT